MANSVSSSNPRRSKGRQKIEMKKMTNESNLQVTFSKRRSGLFKKASELCTLCGVEVALIVFSPGEKVFSFGHPNVETVIDRYLMRAPQQNSGTLQFIEAHRSANVRELNAQLTQINADLEIEKKCSDELSRLHSAAKSQFWWASPIDEMNSTQLEQFKLALKDLKKGFSRQVSANNPPPPPQFFAGVSNSNNPMMLQQQPQCPPQPQMFPLTTQQHMPQHPSMMMFDAGMMRYPGFNNIGGGFGPSGSHGFF